MSAEAWDLQQIRIFGQGVSGLELIAFATGLASVWLALRMRIANWPVGLISVVCYAVLFFHAKLYADALLQSVFVWFGIAGWRAWATAGGTSAAHAVTCASRRERTGIAAIALLSTSVVALLLALFTDSPAPLFDAAIFVLSLLAIWWQMQKKLESWWLWIAVDLISIPVYWSRNLPLSAILYAVFLALCIAGLRAWRSRMTPLAGAA